jgi:nucleotide-binding universal stress UspA family protein
MKHGYLKVLWAIDAADPYPATMRRIAETLRRFEKASTLEIHPVFVLSPEQLELSQYLAGEPVNMEEGASKALEFHVRESGIAGLRKPMTLIEPLPSLKKFVQKLVNHAHEGEFDFIVVGTHGKKGFERMVTGSFTEELLFQSQTPVLTVGPHTETWADSENRILIPTDLTDLDSPFFPEVFQLTKNLAAKATILHAIPRPLESLLQSSVYLLSGASVPVPLYLRNEKMKQEPDVERIRELAVNSGIDCEGEVDHLCASVVESILNHAREKKVTLIAMVAQSAPFVSALLGSITRKIVRDAPCPVWVMRTPLPVAAN